MNVRSAALLSVMLFGSACAGTSESPAPAATTPPAATPAGTSGTMPADHAGMPGMAMPPTTEPAMITSAMSAGPESISKDATIVAMDDKMQIKTIRKGTNMWTCMPDGPSPGVDPMCVDKNGLEWVTAWMAHKDPPADKLGFGYMLMGGSDASNDDPFATTPPAGKPWVDTGPHVMVLNIGKRFEGYPTSAADPKQPYVMYPNTPYAHLMIPVK